MNKQDNFLLEIHCEELPPKVILKLVYALESSLIALLQKAELSFNTTMHFATPRRLAVLINQLSLMQKDRIIERKGPAISAAYDPSGQATAACIGFAKSCGVAVSDLIHIKQDKGEWVGATQVLAGQSVFDLLPDIVAQAIQSLPLPKKMRWGDQSVEFSRPVHSIMMLYGEHVIPAEILACQTGRQTRGHRFYAPDWIDIPHADLYASLLLKAKVMANFEERKQSILALTQKVLPCHQSQQLAMLLDEALLEEVTGLVEWPAPLCGTFDTRFLTLPKEVLISSMQDHQRYFPVVNEKSELQAYFITVSNMENHASSQIVQGNERVLRARLADAAFFYQQDQQIALAKRVDKLKGIVFQAKLGSLYDKAQRIQNLSISIARCLKENEQAVKRAALLAKADLTTYMVGEFPELQGIMGGYYALHNGESEIVALAIKEHYYPRFSGDVLPSTQLGKVLAVADRIDTLIGIFGIGHIPSGDKDPYGLRRAALGIVRLIVNGQLSFDLFLLLQQACKEYGDLFNHENVVNQVFNFIMERMRIWYQEQGMDFDIFAAVFALQPHNLVDLDNRIQAVHAFKTLPEAGNLSLVNKRVGNIIAKYTDEIEANEVDEQYFVHDAERLLAVELEQTQQVLQELLKESRYQDMLFKLASLHHAVDNFFNHVMVMADEKRQRENRILLLKKLRAQFLQVADIALLQ